MRVLAIFCAAFAAGVALSQYLLSAQWALILCGVFAALWLTLANTPHKPFMMNTPKQ